MSYEILKDVDRFDPETLGKLSRPFMETPKFPFRDMNIGDAFFVESENDKALVHTLAKKAGIRVTSDVRQHNGKYGLMVWRIG